MQQQQRDWNTLLILRPRYHVNLGLPIPLMMQHIFSRARLASSKRAQDSWRRVRRVFQQFFAVRRWAKVAEERSIARQTHSLRTIDLDEHDRGAAYKRFQVFNRLTLLPAPQYLGLGGYVEQPDELYENPYPSLLL